MNKESQNIEWKETWRDEYLKWICGFANAQGGTIIIGMNDDGQVLGITNARHLLEEIPNKVRDVLGIMVAVNIRQQKHIEYLEIHVDSYPSPVSYKGQYYYRSGSTKQELKGAALDKFLLQKQGKRWDGVPVPHLTLSSLSKEAFSFFRKNASRTGRLSAEVLKETNRLLLENLKLYEGAYLKRAVVLLFHPNPEKFVAGAFVKIGFFRTDDNLLFQDTIHGHLFEQVNKTMDLLLTKYMKAGIRYDGINRIEVYPFPEAALREAVLNAIAHKDYSSGIPIQVSVYEDKIMIWNSGQLPDHWTVERLTRKHPSVPYNPDIAIALFRAGLIETWGIGTIKMITECKYAGLPAPAFSYDPTGFMIEFRENDVNVVSEGASEKIPKMSEKTSEKTSEKIIGFIKANSQITIQELAARINISERSIERNLQKLQHENKLERVGPDKGGHWRIIR